MINKLAYETFGEFVTRALGELNISDRDFAHAFDMSRPTLRRWKTGRSFPHPIMQQRVIEYFQKNDKTV